MSSTTGAAAASAAEEDENAKKQKAFDDAVDRFKALDAKLGGADKVKAFFDIYGTEGFAPPKGKPEEKKPEEKKATSPDATAAAKELLKDHKIDTAIKDRAASELSIPTRPPGYGATYLQQDWQIKQISGIDNPATLKEEAWHVINTSNSIFHGFVVRNDKTISRARHPAFHLKPKDGKSGTDAITSIPDFEVFDNSSISIKETSSEFESSMAENSFSSLAIQAAIAGGYGGFSAGISAGRNEETAKGEANAQLEQHKEYTATYSFPRARVFLDEYNLELTAKCLNKVAAIRDAHQKILDNMKAGKPSDDGDAVKTARLLCNSFYEQFGIPGHIYATTLQLGGQLLATRSAESIAGATDETKKDAMKISAALSFGSPYVAAASMGFNRENQSSEKAREASVANASALTWSAQGGNTLLVASPPEWANSLASFSTWRALERDQILPIVDLISKLTDTKGQKPWSDISDRFLNIKQENFNELPTVPAGTWTGKIRLELLETDFKLGILTSKETHTDFLKFSNKLSDPQEEIVFTVLDADVGSKDVAVPRLSALYADSPLFLVTSDKVVRQSAADGGQILGLTVNSDGWIVTRDPRRGKISRWSLRPIGTKVDFETQWMPNQVIIKDGDEVALYCHSYGSAFYRDASEPPYYAPCAHSQIDKPCFFLPDIRPSVLKDFYRNPFYEDLDPTKMNSSELEKLAQVYDRLQTSAEQQVMAETITKLFGFKDEFNMLFGWRAKKFRDDSAKEAAIETLTAKVQTAITESLRKGTMDPTKAEVTRFKVRYV